MTLPPRTRRNSWRRAEPAAAILLCLSLLTSLVYFVHLSLHWPLVGDAPLLHYGVLLMRHGWAPYRQFVDPNLPGAYAAEYLVIRLFGYGALAWRLYDLALLAMLGAAAVALLWSRRHPRRTTLAALWVLTVFAMQHGRDGLIDLGQRDLLLTALLAAACALALAAQRSHRTGSLWLWAGAGLCIGAAATVKAPALLLLVLPLLGRPRRRGALRVACAGAALPLLGALLFLVREHALSAFLQVETRLVPLHSSLFRKPALLLAAGVVSSTVLPLVLLSLPAVLRSRPWRSAAGRILLAGFLLGALSFVVQGRGYPYHRYPSLFFLLVLCSRGFLLAGRRSRVAAAGAVAAVLVSVAVTLPYALRAMRSFTTGPAPFRVALETALQLRGGPALSGHVQCFDMAGGCTATLLDLRLLPATGFLYDCYALAPVSPAFFKEQQRYRRAWLAALARSQPALLIVTSDECGPADALYTKLQRWPALDALVQAHYRLVQQWQSTQTENWNGHPALPYGFRLYARHAVKGGAATALHDGHPAR